MSLLYLEQNSRLLVHILDKRDGIVTCTVPASRAWLRITEHEMADILLKFADVIEVRSSSSSYQDNCTRSNDEAPSIANIGAALSFFNKFSNNPESLSEQTLTRHPIASLTNTCNLKCSYCYVGAPSVARGQRKSLNRESVLNFIDTMNAISPVRSLQLFGGEPTINPQFVEIVNAIRARNILVRVSTNLTSRRFQTSDFARLYEDGGVEWRVSIDSIDDAEHDVERGKGNFSRVLSNLDFLLKHHAVVSIRSTLKASAISSLPRMARFCADRRMQLTYGSIIDYGEAKSNHERGDSVLHALDRELFDAVSSDLTLAPWIVPSPLGWALKCLYLDSPPQLARFSLYLAESGEVFPLDSLQSESYRLGSVEHIDFEKATEIQEKFGLSSQRCSTCAIQPYCYTGHFGELLGAADPETSEFRTCNDKRLTYKMLMECGDRSRRIVEHMFPNVNVTRRGAFYKLTELH
jgi:MoaA/NifB/PqqE/SkfB family radical SAM enzyme